MSVNLDPSLAGRIAGPGISHEAGHARSFSPWGTLLASALIALAGLAVYANSFSVPFIYDDVLSITENPSIRHLWPVAHVLSPPRHGGPITGRPLLNLSFAIDFAIHGEHVWGYHAVNLAIHIINGLLLFGILRRTFLLPTLEGRFGNAATGLALAAALLWTVHPLQTESVTYISQRAESLASLFYLLVLYGTIRGATSRRATLWYTLAVGACWLGMASKEIVATVPLIVFLYDRAFLTGSWRQALRRRYGLYLALTAAWLLLAGLMVFLGGRGGAAGFGYGMTSWEYARTQCNVVLHYVRLSFWPSGLCLGFDDWTAQTWQEILPGAVFVVTLVATVACALVHWPKTSFLGAFFLVVLAPSSSIIPLHLQTMAEHRMYLPLASVVTSLVVGGHLIGQRLVQRGWLGGRMGLATGVGGVILAALVLGLLTLRRNEVYRSELSIWQDTLAKTPGHAQSYQYVGIALSRLGQMQEAIESYRKSLQIRPDYFDAHTNYGTVLMDMGHVKEATEHYQRALQLRPESYLAHTNLGRVLASSGRYREAIEHYQHSLQLNPDAARTHNNLGNALAATGSPSQAIEHYQRALQLQPDLADAHYNWSNALRDLGRWSEAIDHCQQTLRVNPDFAPAHGTWGDALAALGRTQEAIEHYQQALRRQPDLAQIHNNLASILAESGRMDEAIDHFREAVQILPQHAAMQANLAASLAQAGRLREAVNHGRQAIRLRTDRAEPYRFVAWLLATHEAAEVGDTSQAVEFGQRACLLTNRLDLASLDTLAAAYASAGRFDEAATTANEAWQLAQAGGQSSLAEEIHMRLQLYRSHKPYREPTGSPARQGR